MTKFRGLLLTLWIIIGGLLAGLWIEYVVSCVHEWFALPLYFTGAVVLIAIWVIGACKLAYPNDG